MLNFDSSSSFFKQSKEERLEQNKRAIPKAHLSKSLGPLYLLSEELKQNDTITINTEYNSGQKLATVRVDKAIRNINLESIKTTRELRDSIFAFGYSDVNDVSTASSVILNPISTQAAPHSTPNLERQETLETFVKYKEKKMDNEKINLAMERLRPGHTAKRYLSNLTKHWRPDMIVNLARDGRLVEDNFFEPSRIQPKDKLRIDDNISRVPATYRIHKDWLQPPPPSDSINANSSSMANDFDYIYKNIKNKELKNPVNHSLDAIENTQITESVYGDEATDRFDEHSHAEAAYWNNRSHQLHNNTMNPIEEIKTEKKMNVKKIDSRDIINQSAENRPYYFPALGGHKLQKNYKPLFALRSQPPLDRNIKERRYSVDVLPDIHKMSNVDNPMTRSFDGGESNSFLPTSNNKSGKHVKFDPSIDNLFEEKEDDNYFNVKDGSKKEYLNAGLTPLDPRNDPIVLGKVGDDESKKRKKSKASSGGDEAAGGDKKKSKYPKIQIIDRKEVPGVIIVAPDGEIVKAGIAYNDEEHKKAAKDDDDVIYRLYEAIVPFLYYTNKLDHELNLDFEGGARFHLDDNDIIKASMNMFNLKRVPKQPKKFKKVLMNLLSELIVHAQQMADKALSSGSNETTSSDLTEDMKATLQSNFKKLVDSYKRGEINTKDFKEYTKLMKKAFRSSLTQLNTKLNDLDESFVDSLFELPDLKKINKNLISNLKNLGYSSESEYESFSESEGELRSKRYDESEHEEQDDNNHAMPFESKISRDKVKMKDESEYKYKNSRITPIYSRPNQDANNQKGKSLKKLEEEAKKKADSDNKNKLGQNGAGKETDEAKKQVAAKTSTQQAKSTSVNTDTGKDASKIKSDVKTGGATTTTTNVVATASNAEKMNMSNQKDPALYYKATKADIENDQLAQLMKSVTDGTVDEKRKMAAQKAQKKKENNKKRVFKFGPIKEQKPKTLKNSSILNRLHNKAGGYQVEVKKAIDAKEIESNVKKLMAEMGNGEDGVIEGLPEGMTEEELAKLGMQEAFIGNESVDVKALKKRMAAEKKLLELKKRRQEMEEKAKRDKEEQQKREWAEKSQEEQNRLKDQEAKLRKMAEDAKKRKELKAIEDEENRKRELAEMQRKAKEEKEKQVAELKAKILQERAEKAKIEMERQLEEERRQMEEEVLMAKLNEKEREEYIKKKLEQEREAKRKAEEEKRRREEEANKALLEVKKLAAEEARRKAELQKRLTFFSTVREEAERLENSQQVTRAFVYSYFELLDSLAHNLQEIKQENTPQGIDQILSGEKQEVENESKRVHAAH